MESYEKYLKWHNGSGSNKPRRAGGTVSFRRRGPAWTREMRATFAYNYAVSVGGGGAVLFGEVRSIY